MKLINRIFRLLFRLSGFLLLAALVAAMISPHADPYHCWIISFFGLAYPLLWLANLLNALLNIRFRIFSRVILIILLAGLPMMLKHFGVYGPDKYILSAGGAYTLVTYNVHGFSDISGKKSVYDVQFLVHELYARENAGLICMQEYPVRRNPSGGFNRNMNISPLLPHNHLSWYEPDGIYMESVLMTSTRQKIQNQGTVYSPDIEDFAIYTDISFPEGTVRVYNVHLQSLMLKEERSLLNNSTTGYIKKSTLRQGWVTAAKLRRAFILRSYQAKCLAQHIQQSPWPVIVAGDFNDTPASFAYRILSKGLCDSFESGGQGFTTTFSESHYPIRIDHVLASPQIKILSYERKLTGYSDHYPIVVRFSFRNSN
ncbi:endonuclease/exonuclease/phosphatase family protein [Lentimicrobium sp.]|uniref:endonuclease/exonuclease/phosphatase family protein n=1 Tax=Lentimicrobium sp. TaxID=2034841 RepID=UPI002C056BB3|nr:endonuclease/exonuclease/phosphatase family protein [Lentimicrobium sp.]HPF63228.1 endonuclease/exonuclease/phosphatase family protein [Lentimicrobium sp.]HPR24848.1 endonuclease/exonuclease/phosphatase family protein [Lentimicrobium sp.]HRW68133.1 endonuclease/exonuclease/phosphatase family protein [Lentimicrobium sp.]